MLGPSPGPLVRPAGPADLSEIQVIYAHYVEQTCVTFELVAPDRAEWRARLRTLGERGLPFLVAELDGAVAGYAHCAPWKARAAYAGTVEDSVYVAPWAQRRGVGGALMAALLARSAEAGAREVIAVVADTGDPASGELHRRHGFRPVGRLTGVGVKHGRRWDTVLLQRSLVGRG